MKPYYEDSHVTIYHGDCREVLRAIKDIDLIVTDPPYGVRYESSWRVESFGPISGDDSLEAGRDGLASAASVLRAGRHLYAFGGWNLLELKLRSVTDLVWDKGRMSVGDLDKPWGNQHEIISFGIKSDGTKSAVGQQKKLRRGSVLRVPRVDGNVLLHPTEKPVRLLRELIEASSRFGELVLDPFMGSGSTLVAARLECRRSIGIEVEERYCEVAARRLAQGALELFGDV